MGKSSLPPGFRFHPTHVELIMFYLKRKVMEKSLPPRVISELDIYKYAPWDLPDKSCLKSRDLKWYFFCPRERKYASGARMNRATEYGYWKSTGKDRAVNHNDEVVGQIKTLTFFRGKPPKGEQTDWVMHEYRIEEKDLSNEKDSYVLCVIFQKDGPGPRNGAQYGAPFKEDEWDDDGDVVEEVGVASLDIDPCAGPSIPSCLPPGIEPQNSLTVDIFAPRSNYCSAESNVSEILTTTSKETPQIYSTPMEIPLILDNDDDVFSIQDFFPEDENMNLNHAGGNQETQNMIDGHVTTLNPPDRNDIYRDLEDLGYCGTLSEGGYACCSDRMIPSNEAIYGSDQMSFLELNDLVTPLSCTAEGSKYEDIQTSNLIAACDRLNAIEKPCSSSISFGASKQLVPSNHHPLLYYSNDQVYDRTELGFPEQHISSSSRSSWQYL